MPRQEFRGMLDLRSSISPVTPNARFEPRAAVARIIQDARRVGSKPMLDRPGLGERYQNSWHARVNKHRPAGHDEDSRGYDRGAETDSRDPNSDF